MGVLEQRISTAGYQKLFMANIFQIPGQDITLAGNPFLWYSFAR